MDTARPGVHVAMIVGNDVTSDTRVKKTAASLTRHGYDVTVLALSPSGSRAETSMGDVRIIRLPVDFVLRDRRRPRTLLRLGYASKDHYVAAKRRSKVAERELLAYVGRQRARREKAGQSPLRRKVTRQGVGTTIKVRKAIVRAQRGVVTRRQTLWRRRLEDQQEDRQGSMRSALARLSGATPLRRSWRRLLPEIDDYELSYGPELDRLQPDVIHAHDVHMIGIAERAAARARLTGRHVRWIYDAHEFVPGLARYGPGTLSAYVGLEREYIRRADRVITVSDPIADELQRSFRLERKPAVVMNAPLPVPLDKTPAPSVRHAAGLHDDVPLLVYSGGADPARGLRTVIEALPLLPSVHVALVVKSDSTYLRSLRRMAAELSCGDRLHVVPFVPPEEVVNYLSSATAAVHPLTHYGNHEVALPNKLFEYLHARLPVVVSDVRAMAELTRRLGTGEVFRAGDPKSFAQAAAKVLANPGAYRRVLEENPDVLRRYSWPEQEKILLGLYQDLVENDIGPRSSPETRLSLAESKAGDEHVADVVVALGPRNMAGQAWAWAKALERVYPEARTRVFTVEKRSPIIFPTDVRVPASSWKSLEWQLTQLRHVLESYTHVLLESGSGLWGPLNGPFYDGDLPSLSTRGIGVGVVLHGSEVRDPRRHRELEPWSPFKDASSELCHRLQQGVDALLPRLQRFTGPLFVTTMDLRDYLPAARWLPVVVDPQVWVSGSPPLDSPRPVVVHAPSHERLKGSALIEQVVTDLDTRGVIEYRRVRDVPPEDMPQVIAGADVVLDQFALGDYGAVAVQAMAAGRVVIGHVHERVRTRLPADVPIVEATPDTLGGLLEDVVARRAHYVDVARRGPSYVAQFHDGTFSAGQLAGFLGRESAPRKQEGGGARAGHAAG